MEEKKPNRNVFTYQEAAETSEAESPTEGEKATEAKVKSDVGTPAQPGDKVKSAKVPASEQGGHPDRDVPLSNLSWSSGFEEDSVIGWLTEFLKRTRRLWLMAGGGVLVVLLLVAVVSLIERVAVRTTSETVNVPGEPIADVTPENLMAQCGAPAADVTSDLYPMVKRTMSYPAGANENIVFTFSRTAERDSAWVFLSMAAESGSKNYDKPEAKLAAMPCLAAKK